MNNNFCFLIYTNEKYLPIADLTMSEFDNFYKKNYLKKYLVSNKFTDYKFKNNNAIHIDCDIKFDANGAHFSQTLIKALEKINEKYIIFFCDDYMLIDEPKHNVLEELMSVIEDQNIDFFTFCSTNPQKSWEKYSLDLKSNDNRFFYNIPEDYQYLYNVQPCVWKKESLLEILTHNPDISLHDLDTTNIKNKEGFARTFNLDLAKWNSYPSGSQNYNLKNICTDYRSFNDYDNKYDFFIFPYVEIIRWGSFNTIQETKSKEFLKKFILERNIEENEHLKKFLLLHHLQ